MIFGRAGGGAGATRTGRGAETGVGPAADATGGSSGITVGTLPADGGGEGAEVGGTAENAEAVSAPARSGGECAVACITPNATETTTTTAAALANALPRYLFRGLASPHAVMVCA